MWFFGSLLVLGASFVALVFPFWAMSRAGEAKRRAEEAEKRMQAMERLLEKLRAEILSLREAGPTPAFEASAPSSHPAAESAAVFEAAFAAAGPVVEALPPAMTQQQARSLFDPPPPEPRVEPAPPRSTKVLRKGKQHREPASARESREHAHPHPPPPPPPPPESASPIIEAQGPIIEAHPIEAQTHAPSAEPAPLSAAPRKPARQPLPARGSDAEVRAAVARYSAWNESVRPFLVENVGWFIGGFLVIAGSLFWIRLAWNAFEAVGRHLLSVTVLLAYAAGFVGVGFWLKKKQALPTASRAMAYVGLSLLPVALLSAAALFPSSHLAR